MYVDSVWTVRDKDKHVYQNLQKYFYIILTVIVAVIFLLLPASSATQHSPTYQRKLNLHKCVVTLMHLVKHFCFAMCLHVITVICLPNCANPTVHV